MPKATSSVFDLPDNADADQRAKMCLCGHTRGNHRWYAIGGKHQCFYYEIESGERCNCEAFHVE